MGNARRSDTVHSAQWGRPIPVTLAIAPRDGPARNATKPVGLTGFEVQNGQCEFTRLCNESRCRRTDAAWPSLSGHDRWTTRSSRLRSSTARWAPSTEPTPNSTEEHAPRHNERPRISGYRVAPRRTFRDRLGDGQDVTTTPTRDPEDHENQTDPNPSEGGRRDSKLTSTPPRPECCFSARRRMSPQWSECRQDQPPGNGSGASASVSSSASSSRCAGCGSW